MSCANKSYSNVITNSIWLCWSSTASILAAELHSQHEHTIVDILSVYHINLHAYCSYTINGERFTGLNFCIFHSFHYRKSFSVNISLFSFVLNNEHLWPRQCESISMKTSMALKPRIFSPANLSPSTVYHL